MKKTQARESVRIALMKSIAGKGKALQIECTIVWAKYTKTLKAKSQVHLAISKAIAGTLRGLLKMC